MMWSVTELILGWAILIEGMRQRFVTRWRLVKGLRSSVTWP